MKTIEAKAKEYAESLTLHDSTMDYMYAENGFTAGYTACLSDTGEEVKALKEEIERLKERYFTPDQIANIQADAYENGFNAGMDGQTIRY